MRFLHTMIRVGDLQRSVDFYTRIMGMKLIKTMDFPEGNSPWLIWVMKATRRRLNWN